ncbi:hypothetical protein N8I71_15960 [Roseibacterium sp. SDUM158016]|uniref:hypothetical protein n=1 Tax=Roseicyclus sediminis TaxID=2980997 RepID=UPI0021D0600A|nr:hypothetical protein [Roseibacterium sp. SDUM158016]MCU4654336.1 hypothetical protein [Roseibacterium sp. SDUM158016]
MWYAHSAAVAGLLGCLASAVLADVVSEAPPAETVGGRIHVQPLALGGHVEGGYLAVRAERLDALAAAQVAGVDADDAVARALLDLAMFHLARGFVSEGRTVVEAISTATLDPDLAARRNQLAAALSVIDPLWQGDVAQAVAALEGPPDSADSVFRAYGLQRLGDNEAASDVLSGAIRSFDALPPPLVERMLPALFSAAVIAEDWFLAHGLAERLTRVDRHGGGALSYLLGTVALGGGQDLVAFEHFVEASSARDAWGHRARLAIVRLGLDYEAIGHDEALGLLARADSLWRGDEDDLETLLEMERVAIEGGDSKSAALALGDLVLRYPNAPEAETAPERAMAHVRDYYTAGTSGGIPLEAFIEGHRELSSIFRFTPGYEQSSEIFAGHMRVIGAAAAAAEEFRLTREYLEASGELGLREPVPEQLDQLRLREAEAHLASGRMEAAAELLDAALLSQDAALLERLQLLRSRYASRMGEPLADWDAELPRSEEVLRIEARRLVSDRAWEEARDTYVELWRMLEDDLPPADAIGLLVAAERSGDIHLAETVAALLAGRNETLARVLVGGAAPSASGPDLGSASARALLERADEALQRVGVLVEETATGLDEANEETQQ